MFYRVPWGSQNKDEPSTSLEHLTVEGSKDEGKFSQMPKLDPGQFGALPKMSDFEINGICNINTHNKGF